MKVINSMLISTVSPYLLFETKSVKRKSLYNQFLYQSQLIKKLFQMKLIKVDSKKPCTN